MTFAETLNQYMEHNNLTISELSRASGVSKSVISRYKTGKREPSADSEILQKLSAAIAGLSEKDTLDDEIYHAFTTSLKTPLTGNRQVRDNLNCLIDTLNINVNNLSRYLNFDPSYLSRIRSGKRFPADILKFCEQTAKYVALHFSSGNSAPLTQLIGCSAEELANPEGVRRTVSDWLLNNSSRSQNPTRLFLGNLDSFDLNEYMRLIHFDTLSLDLLGCPSSGLSCRKTKVYSDLTGFMEAELDWIRETVLSDTCAPVILYSDMPMKKMAKDPDFPKKWMMGIALLLKRGLHLNVIHCIDRSFHEMLLGLISWIPLYMTGQVSSYYFKNFHDPVFCHFLRVSGSASLSGESISGFHQNGRYRLSKDKEEIAYYRQYGENMLAKASPLIEIYHSHQAEDYTDYLENTFFKQGCPYHSVLSTLPIYTLSEEWLTRFLTKNRVDEEKKKQILTYAKLQRDSLSEQLSHGTVTDVVPLLSEEEYAQFPVCLPLADLFYEKEIAYTYKEYQEHISMAKAYSKTHPAYQCRFTKSSPFRNIQIRMALGNVTILSKNKSPAIHFVIKHPKLRQAIEDMYLPS